VDAHTVEMKGEQRAVVCGMLLVPSVLYFCLRYVSQDLSRSPLEHIHEFSRRTTLERLVRPARHMKRTWVITRHLRESIGALCITASDTD
jgi:hypothetical protein